MSPSYFGTECAPHVAFAPGLRACLQRTKRRSQRPALSPYRLSSMEASGHSSFWAAGDVRIMRRKEADALAAQRLGVALKEALEDYTKAGWAQMLPYRWPWDSVSGRFENTFSHSVFSLLCNASMLSKV